MFSLFGIRSKGTSGNMDWCLSQNSDTALSRRSGDSHRSALHSHNFRHPIASNDFGKNNDRNSFVTVVVSPEKEDVAVHSTCSESNKPNNTTGLSQNILSLRSDQYSADNQCSLSQEDDRRVCNCNATDLQNHDSRRQSDATYSHLSRIFSIMAHYFNLVFRSSVSWRTDCRSKNGWRILFSFLIHLLCTRLCAADVANRCAAGVITPGWTSPRGDITIEYGKPLKILCTINQTYVDTNFPGRNVSDLVFFRNSRQMEPEFITIINETTISLDVQKPPPASDMYSCKLKLENHDLNKEYEAVCLNQVVVGFKPQQPRNFSCVSHNWENMICSWIPVQNYANTKFTLMFKLPGRAGRRKMYPCPQEHQEPTKCTWNTSTNPIYRQPYPQMTMILYAENPLGNTSFVYKFEHFAHVIPAKPANLSVINKTSDSVLLSWSAPFPMVNFPPGLNNKIMYQNQWDHLKNWTTININNNNHTYKMKYELANLTYANTIYDVRVFMKSAVATSDDMWSDFSNVTFRTPPRVPGQSPQTDIGSFEVAENNVNRDVYLYWQTIPQKLENGDDFKYQIDYVEENGRRVANLVPNETTRTYAKFKGLSFNSYQFRITATNIIGPNETYATIFVPSQSEMPQEPIAFTKIVFGEGLYELSWKPPTSIEKITNYTIFWCESALENPHQCTGYLDWTHVSKNITMFNKTVPDTSGKVYQFAISANTRTGSSGMVWASCTVMHDKMLGKMKSVWINRIGSHFIELSWKLHCSDRIGIVEGFKIYYCPIVSPLNTTCRESKLNTTITADPHTIHGIINNLKPYTTYMVCIAILTKSGEGMQSDPLYNTTLEGAPSTPPQHVQIVNGTNTTMFITWDPPQAMNGVLRYYEVYYNQNINKVEENNHVELRNLSAYKNYSISVTACTVSCSERSPIIYYLTQIGMPGKINIPAVRFINSSQVSVNWTVPQETAGPLHYYEILTSDGEIQNSTTTAIQLPIPNCKIVGREHHYLFRIRAVNIAENNAILKGPWSEPGEGNCYSDGPSFRVWVIIWVIGSLSGVAFILCLAYTSKRMWLKCRAMQDVEVKLPPGLAPNMKLLEKVGEQHVRQPSADSSGCSSGQESVTSSLTADSQVSGDSGTEVDQIPVLPDKLLEGLSIWESSSLRQRNITRPNALQTAHCNTYVKTAKSGEPILGETMSLARSTPNLTDSTGYTTSQHTWSSTGYISMPSSEELSSNPSPVPKENPNTNGGSGDGGSGSGGNDDDNGGDGSNGGSSGGYSVVSSVPKIRIKSEDDTILTDADALIPIELKTKKSANPYVALATLEHKSKEKKKQSMIDTFRDIDNLTFAKSGKCTTLDELTRHFNTVPEQISQPYVQTGLIDTLQKPFILSSVDHMSNNPTSNSFASTTLTDSCGKPFMSPFVLSSTSSQGISNKLTETLSLTKPYVTVSIPEMTKSSASVADGKKSSSQQLYRNYGPTSKNASSKPYVLAGSVQRILPRGKTESSANVAKDDENETFPALSWQEIGDIGEKESSIKLDSSVDSMIAPVIAKRNTGYVTIVENPNREHQGSIVVTTTPSHERSKKPLPPLSQTVTGQSTDEQYSKVTVVPSTIQ